MTLLAILLAACAPTESRVQHANDHAGANAAPRVLPEPLDSAEPGDTSSRQVRETFLYTRPKVDVLLIVDNSSSMFDKNDLLAEAVGPMVDDWIARGIDFHAGAVDIDANDWQGTLEEHDGVRWVDETTDDPAGTLTQLVGGVPDYSSCEAGRRAAWLALHFADDGGPNAGFLRDGAELDLLVQSDDDDASDTDPTRDDFVAYLEALRPDPEQLHFHTIADVADYTGLSDELGGVIWSMGDTPYDPALEQVTDMFHRTDVFTLAGHPDPATLAAFVDGVPLATFRYDAATNTVDLEGTPLVEGSRVSFSYVPR
jgi:hypothetical protein